MALSNDEKQTIKNAVEIIERECANDGDDMVVRGFGTFKRKHVAAKVARNPATGGTVNVAAKSVLRFKASPSQSR